jgi:formylglycine-generating enzyme required for sulfatase activity
VRLPALSSIALVCLGATRAEAEPARNLTVNLGIAPLELVLVPKGEETQGSPPSEKGHDDDERAHDVVLTADYYMGKYPVTRRQFGAFAVSTGYRTEAEIGSSGGFGWNGKELVQRKDFTWRNPGFPQSEDDPVTLVTFKDAEAFATWAGKVANRRVDLPTEAQWEHAARGGRPTAYATGDGEEAALALGWFKKNAGDGTHPVGTKAANAFGLYDMGGNVFEWCRDWYAPYPAGKVIDPVVETPSGDTARRVLRGGSWLKDARWGRAAARYKNTPGSRNADNGFRIVASTETLAPAASTTIPPAPPPVQEPVRSAPAATTNEPSSINPVFIVIGAGGLAVLLYALLRRRTAAETSDDTSGPALRTGQDGFWIEDDLPAGTRVKYACTVQGMPVTDTVTVEGARTFVYTGGAPQDVRILEVTRVHHEQAPAPGFGYRGPTAPAPVQRVITRDSDPPPPPAAPPFQGFPPAY